MRMTKMGVAATALALVCTCGAAFGSLGKTSFPFMKSLAPMDEPSHRIGAFRLDEEIFVATDRKCSNMRVFDDNGVEIQFLVRPLMRSRTVVRENEVRVTATDFKLLPENRFSLVVSRRDERSVLPVSVLVLSSALRNFEKTVTVSSSSDGAEWRTLVENTPIYDYSKYLDLRNDRARFAPDTNRFYRIEVSNITEEEQSPLVQIARESRDGKLYKRIERTSLNRRDFRIERVKALHEREVKYDIGRKLRDYAVDDMSARDDEKQKTTVITFRTGNTPLREIHISIDDSHFSRSLSLEGNPHPRRNSTWEYVADATISRVPIGSAPIERPFVVLERPCRYVRYRATIRNLDSPPLSVSGVTLKGEVHEAVFLTEPERAFTVMYGARKGRVPRYDIGTVVREARQADVDTYRPGEQKENPIFGGSTRTWMDAVLEGRALMIAAIVIMVLLLLWIIARVAKKVEQEGEDTQAAA